MHKKVFTSFVPSVTVDHHIPNYCPTLRFTTLKCLRPSQFEKFGGTVGRTNGWTEEQTDGQTDGRTDGWGATLNAAP